MLKKAIPLFLLSALVLGACNMNGAAPDNNNNNDTPMQNDVQDRDQNWTPNVQDEQRGGTDLDGLDNDRGGNGNGGNGVINDNNTNGVINEGNMVTPHVTDDNNR